MMLCGHWANSTNNSMLRTQTRNLTAILLTLALKLLLVSSTFAATLEWDANPEANVIGYRVYYGAHSRLYGYVVDVGNVTQYVATNLFAPTTYFAITAYDSDGLESDYSAEVFYSLVPVAKAMTAFGLEVSPEEEWPGPFVVYATDDLNLAFNLLGVYASKQITLDRTGPQRFFQVYRHTQ